MKETRIDIRHIPFSRYGAYVSVTHDRDHETGADNHYLTIHTVRRRFEESPLFTLSFGQDGKEKFECMTVPELLTVKTETGTVSIYVRDDDTLVLESEGVDLNFKLLHWGYGAELGEKEFQILSGVWNTRAIFALEQGTAILDGPYGKGNGGYEINRKTDLSVGCEDGKILMAVSLSVKEPNEIVLPLCPDQEIAAVAREWEDFLAEMEEGNAVDPETENFVRVTWYNLWSSFVRAEGVYPKDTMVMAKKRMTSTWSWDHCFNALAMAHLKDKALAKEKALDQFMAPFVLQTSKGCLPDMWNPDLETRWGTTKPPIHGWCFSLLMDRFTFTKEELQTVYDCLEKWTNWWICYSDTDHDGIPDYPQGCDSGWDNGSLFDPGYFVETPDLPAFLSLQMKTLGRIAEQLGQPEKKQEWDTKADAMLARLMDHSWNGERFVAKLSRSHLCKEQQPTCLQSLMPLILGEDLPKEMRDKLVAVLEQDFLTENGPATEMPESAQYESDGYWRGPIWAPSTYLLVDGLRRGGYTELAKTVAERYCTMSCKKAKGNYENFDALTGKGLRAPGYTWSASVYMLLHWEFDC